MTILKNPLSGHQLTKPADTEAGTANKDDSMEELIERQEMILTKIYLSKNGTPSVWLSLTILIAVLCGIGVYVYAAHSYYYSEGTCHVPLELLRKMRRLKFTSSNRPAVISESIYLDNQEIVSKDGSDVGNGFKAFGHKEMTMLDDTVELDWELDTKEEIEVVQMPQIFNGRYLHDFQFNHTVIVDTQRDACFVMRLNRKLIPEPVNLADLMVKMARGIFSPDITLIRKVYSVVYEKVTDFSEFGYHTVKACSSRSTYWLRENWIRVRRSAADDNNGPQPFEKFGEFTGNLFIQYHIEGIDNINAE